MLTSRKSLAYGLCFFASLAALPLHARTIDISTPSTSMLLDAKPGAPLEILYFGAPLSQNDITSVAASSAPREAYPVYGDFPEREYAMAAVMPDGNMTLRLCVSGEPSTETAPDGAIITAIPMADPQYPLKVVAKYRTYPGDDIIEAWVEAVNTGKKPLTLTRFDSSCLPLRKGDVWISTLSGSWADEANLLNEPLTTGMRIIQNHDGTRNSHTSHAEVMISLDGRPHENSGRVIGAALEWSGNYQLRFNTDPGDWHQFFAGMSERNSSYTLRGGETLATPPLALTFSSKGLGGVSRSFHRWGRRHRLAHGDTPNPVLLNSWEGVYFDINEPGMARMMSDIASMGGELFVMDDGWFGDRFQRNTDNAALGDWTVDTRKLPHGIDGLLKTAEKNGIRFGIWLEPEMTNTMSRLYQTHPEYVIQAASRDTVKGRGGTQLVLDMANPKVQDLVFGIVDTLLTRYPAISYIKWDANAPIMQHGSQYLAAADQSRLNIAYHRGLANTLTRIRAKYPDVMIQACASGGGRVNWGFLPWFDEFWTSDNTDALQRVYMQYATSYFFPAMAMGSHISAVPNHTTRRSMPIKFRTDVAMSGRLGMEIQPAQMTDADKQFCKKAIDIYKKELRQTVQTGDLYRLLSPFDGKGASALMYVSENKDRAVFFMYRTDNSYGATVPRVAMDGLDPQALYTVTEINAIDRKPLPCEGKTFSGAYLILNGLELPAAHDLDWNDRSDFSSRVLLLRKN